MREILFAYNLHFTVFVMYIFIVLITNCNNWLHPGNLKKKKLNWLSELIQKNH